MSKWTSLVHGVVGSTNHTLTVLVKVSLSFSLFFFRSLKNGIALFGGAK
jgi:hypothetical protein